MTSRDATRGEARPGMTDELGRILKAWTAFCKGIDVHPGSTAEAEMYEMDKAIQAATERNVEIIDQVQCALSETALKPELLSDLLMWTKQVGEQPRDRVAMGIAAAARGFHEKLSACAPSATPRKRGKVVAAFISPDTSQWQGLTVNVTEDGSWWRWMGTEWVRDTGPLPEEV